MPMSKPKRKTRRKGIEEELRRAILEARDKKGLNPHNLAPRAGLTEGHLSRIVNRKAAMSLEVAEKIARALGLEIRLCTPELS